MPSTSGHGHESGIKHRSHHVTAATDKDGLIPSSSAQANASTSLGVVLEDSLPPEELQNRRQLCDSGLPDVDECVIPEPPAMYSAVEEAVSRGRWLLGLLIVQSTSSFVLDQYQELLREHIVVTLFLTMLVGAGGNAGNQSAIKVIRGLATGSIKVSWQSVKNTLTEQAAVGLLLGGGLSLGGFLRVYATNGDLSNASAISVSLFLIVMTSVVLGSGLPFALAKLGIDPANAGTSIQVVMDILGVAITCVTCQLVLVQFASSLA